MISQISLLTALVFAAIYPLCFWIHYKNPLKNNFHRFHIGLPVFVGGVTVAFLAFSSFPMPIKVLAIFWEILFLLVCAYYWKKETVNPKIVSIVCLLGLGLLHFLLLVLLQTHSWMILSVWVLGACIFCSALYTMNLGHWYLNVHGLPMEHLMRAVNVFWFFLEVRLVWDIYMISVGQVAYDGERIGLWRFMLHLDGFFLWVAVFFGTLMPLVSLYFVRGTLLVKSSQSATGILYVILSAVLIGDITYKYYLIRHGIAL